MNDGLTFWYGILTFLIFVAGIATVAGILGWAAIRMSVRDDYFSDPDSL
jgi:hypothetical protein